MISFLQSCSLLFPLFWRTAKESTSTFRLQEVKISLKVSFNANRSFLEIAQQPISRLHLLQTCLETGQLEYRLPGRRTSLLKILKQRLLSKLYRNFFSNLKNQRFSKKRRFDELLTILSKSKDLPSVFFEISAPNDWKNSDPKSGCNSQIESQIAC